MRSQPRSCDCKICQKRSVLHHRSCDNKPREEQNQQTLANKEVCWLCSEVQAPGIPARLGPGPFWWLSAWRKYRPEMAQSRSGWDCLPRLGWWQSFDLKWKWLALLEMRHETYPLHSLAGPGYVVILHLQTRNLQSNQARRQPSHKIQWNLTRHWAKSWNKIKSKDESFSLVWKLNNLVDSTFYIALSYLTD